ncbi:MAG: hypothetical protein ACX932_04735 [Gammaproteobacteria bacterium]
MHWKVLAGGTAVKMMERNRSAASKKPSSLGDLDGSSQSCRF